jgi:large subunit ribosomal protein L15
MKNITLSDLRPPKGATKQKKRIGRGPGSGTGKTSGKGHKGQKARTGYRKRAAKEGGQMPLNRRLPKRGFFNLFRVEYQAVNLATLAKLESVETIDAKLMLERRVVRNLRKPIKILANGELDRPLTISADAASAAAIKKIETAGGKFEVAKTC